DVPRAGGAGGRPGTGGRACPAADQCRDAAGDGNLDLLRADEVDVGIDAAGGADLAFARDHLGAGSDHQQRVEPASRQPVAGLTDGHDAAIANPDVSLDDPPVVDDHRVGYDQVAVFRTHRFLGRALVLPVPDRLAAAEDRLLAVIGVIVLDLDDEFRIG